ncbi:MAG: hypothetical protein KKB81_07180 [Candidatus Margulisbacteria bacterium]|nr:hypothetical protein [Candidatus Margulisiibacteriota bacterium]MBU1022336.1 hypothetical protein [Candidatus Margulisiibacteriota bacterium]MBU1728402.1 hypothetical protein [Candidatus Margulisiibacteriota bacterium]MBU1955233.1 hypothetical protein [Candidatus Margulisiibacteriota bacterium]
MGEQMKANKNMPYIILGIVDLCLVLFNSIKGFMISYGVDPFSSEKTIAYLLGMITADLIFIPAIVCILVFIVNLIVKRKINYLAVYTISLFIWELIRLGAVLIFLGRAS